MNKKQMQTWTKYVTLAEKLWEKYHEQGDLISSYEARQVAGRSDWKGVVTMFEQYGIDYPPITPKHEKNYIAWSRELAKIEKPTFDDLKRVMGVKQLESVRKNIARMQARDLPLPDISAIEIRHNNDDKYLEQCDAELARDEARLDKKRIPQKANLVTIHGMQAKPVQNGWYQFI